MNKNNLLVYTEDKKLLYIGENLISRLVRSSVKEPYGYPKGRIHENDLFLLFIPHAEFLTEEQRTAAENASGHALPDRDTVMLVGVYGSSSDDCLMKNVLPAEDAEFVFLHTVFHGHRLRIAKSRASLQDIQVLVDHQQITFPASATVSMTIFNADGLRYYHSDFSASEEESIPGILSGQTFPAFWDEARMLLHPPAVSEILSEDMADALFSVENRPECILPVHGMPCLVQSLQLSCGPQKLHILQITNEEELMVDMHHTSDVYTGLHRSGSQQEITGGYTFGLWGNDEKISRIRYRLQKGAVTNTTILLTGESGTGKTFLAQEIHKCSRRQDKPFVHVNCAAIPYNLLESELFGYEEGAFTGAKKGGKPGYFQMAEHGTLFLDEITELPLSLQGKLLEVMQNRSYFSVGGERKKQADVRIIAATNKNLQDLVSRRLFREDLFYRINVFPIEVPPLRQRLDSLPTIVTDLLPEICTRLDIRQLIISPTALDKMKQYHWPGNIRELENVLEKACILSDGKIILPADIEISPDTVSASSVRKSLKAQREDFEKSVIENTLKLCGGSRLLTARYLDIGKTSLFEKMKKYGIDTNESEDFDHDDERNQ
ncbi:MAG: sigma-54 interaction domain-containing protein [Anaerovoracaceae bacterium]